MRQRIRSIVGKNLAYVTLFLTFLIPQSLNAQFQPPPGTLNSSQSTRTTGSVKTCLITTNLWEWTFIDSNNVAHPFTARTTNQSLSGPFCPDPVDPGEITAWSRDGLYELDADEGSGSIIGVGGTVNPGFKVVSILYVAPGNGSQNGFTQSESQGTVTSVSSSFGTGASVSFSSGIPMFSASVTFGETSTNGSAQQHQETLTDAETLTNKSPITSYNTFDHNQDTFVVWLNPQALIQQDSQNNFFYSLTSQNISGTTPEFDYVLLTAKTIQPDANGNTAVDPTILDHQPDANNNLVLPGLAGICANLNIVEYEANSCTLQDQCGCKASDFAGILATDPLISSNPLADLTTASNPTSITTSGSQICSALSPAPTASASCRYVAVPTSIGGTVQAEQILSGPQCASGCGTNPVTFQQSDAVVNQESFTATNTETTSVSTKIGPIWASVTNLASWTWTNSETSGTTNGQSASMQFTLNSTTPYCYTHATVFEDTIYHTFVLQTLPGNNSCL